ncbi:MAG: purine-binding chemotaxis protein CheW [Acidobacteria bacterium]|nr:purine-binding chemotaxis protein CheW [Acidobacteriota bacterium]
MQANSSVQAHSSLRLNDAAQAQIAGRRQGKYLVFHLGKEEFGVHVLKVREIMGIQEITAVPQTPAFVKGVINLRGKVIPVVDLRNKFSLPETEYTARTCIIVLQVSHEPGAPSIQMGAVVDGVSEVLTIQETEIEDTPEFGDDVRIPYILGMAKVKGRVKILLDIDEVLTRQELHGLEQWQGEPALAS